MSQHDISQHEPGLQIRKYTPHLNNLYYNLYASGRVHLFRLFFKVYLFQKDLILLANNSKQFNLSYLKQPCCLWTWMAVYTHFVVL